MPTSDRVPSPPPALFPASHGQRQLWAVQQLAPEVPAYNLPVALRLEGELDASALRTALVHLVRRHDAFRTSLGWGDGELVQQVAPPETATEWRLEVVAAGPDWSEAERLAVEEACRPFDLGRAPLLRGVLYRVDDSRHLLLLVVHHAVFDEWSERIVLAELGHAYSALVAGARLDDLPGPSLGEATVRQRERLGGGRLDALLAHWSERLSGVPVLTLPTDRVRPPVQTFSGREHRFPIPAPVAGRLRALAARERTTPFVILLAATAVLLHRLTRETDIPVGVQATNRPADAEDVVGFFVNGLVLRCDVTGRPSFRELVRQAQDVLLDAMDHRDLPFERLVDRLQTERDLSRNPLCQVFVVYDPEAPAEIAMADLRVRPVTLRLPVSKFDLTITVEQRGPELTGWLNCNADLFDAALAGDLATRYLRLLDAAAAAPAAPVADLPLLEDGELAEVTGAINRTARPFPSESSIQELFEEQVARAPDAPALWTPAGATTYRELDRRVNRIAHHLRARGVRGGSLVGVCLDRSAAAVEAVLGILKAGGAYLPLDPSHPRERIADTIDDAGLRWVVTGRLARAALPASDVDVIDLDVEAAEIAGRPDGNPAAAAGPWHLAHVIYTSGSTGRPNGVAVSQRAVARLVKNSDYCELGPDQCFVMLSPLSFDASLLDLWGPLLNGGSLAVVEGAAARRSIVDELRAALEIAPVTSALLISPQLHLVVEHAPELLARFQQVLVGGDVLSPAHVARAVAVMRPRSLIHVYGPTESTLFATACTVESVAAGRPTVPIGRPIANTRAYVVDDALRPVPALVPGELCIAGDGLAHGYLGRPALTADRFRPDPFSPGPGGRIYRTGDLARLLPGPDLEFLGRIDDQVKIRGYRVETGEVRSVLCAHPDVEDAAVVVRDDLPGGRGLVAFVVPRAGRSPSRDGLRAHLAGRLAEPMMPAAFGFLDRLPLTGNAKLDRRRLPPTRDLLERVVDEPPRTPTEEAVAGIWREVLRLDAVGRSAHFFDSGGDSVLLVRLSRRLAERYGEAAPRLVELFEHTSVSGIAGLIDARSRPAEEPRSYRF
ncbi:MAG TPA: amino acid adenylation domain-containing protein [Candidatus Dormibacteraeota bacterium]|nr:amino acid adenylation domain-containing protein [Candidatus Dormibacteraeota bacterium]